MTELVTQETLNNIRLEAETILQNSKGSHDLEHTKRVLTLCLHIAAIENADVTILTLAALLHDIGRHCQDTSQGEICHARHGATMALGILTRHAIPSELTERIIHCIGTHRFRSSNPPLSLEAKILFDADKLDAIGAVGIGRAFLFAGEIGAKLHNPGTDIAATREYTIEDTAYREYMVKLRHIKDKMLTREGKRLAEDRHQFMVHFFERLDNEYTGIC